MSILRAPLKIALFAALVVALSVPAQAARPALMRFPTLHSGTIVFEAGGNLWSVDRSGGIARQLTSDKGMNIVPRFSPDGKEIAFTGQYDGNTDVYTMPAEGGPATRLTFHSDVVPEAPLRWGPNNMVVTWTPDSKKVVFLSRRDTFNSWFGRLFLVPRDGGLPTQLPVPKGGMTSYSPDGNKIAYNRIFRNFRTWKDYYGGLAQDIWIYDFTTRKVERVTHWKGTDTYPMWYQNTIYFASDRGPDLHLNIWAYDLNTKAFRQITKFADYDVDWPSLGNNGIVFQCGGDLYVIDLPSEQMHKVDVSIPSNWVETRSSWVDASKNIEDFTISPNGKRALFGARGEVFTVPAQHGDIRDLTQTSGAREQFPAWSPDGAQVAYVTDRTGEAEIAVRPADGSGQEKILTDRTKGYLYGPVWSPGSDKLAYSDSDHALWYLETKGGAPVKVDSDPRAEIRHYRWSPDGLWLAYTKAADNNFGQVYLYSVKAGKATMVSSGMNDNSEPVFGPEGRYLYFLSNRHTNPVLSQTELDEATVKMTGVYVATLQASEPSPFAPRSDEGTTSSEEQAKAKEKKEPSKPGASSAITVDLEGLWSRVVPVPAPEGYIGGLAAAEGAVYWMTGPLNSFGTPLPGEAPQLHRFDMTERKEAVLLSSLDGYDLSADGQFVVYKQKKDYYIAPAKAAAGQAGAEAAKHLDLSTMKADIDPVKEWNEEFHQAWRLERDFFFNPKMNGVDWDAVRTRYEKLLPLLTWREDLNYLIGEMQGSLHNSHTYVGGGPMPHPEPVPTGLLGVDFEVNEQTGRYFFAKIYPGDNSREEFRSPLTEPGIAVKEGDYLLAVNGTQLKAPTNPFSLFVNTVGKTVTLTVASDAGGANSHDVTVKTLASDLNLRTKAWIDGNREKVAKASNGTIGYVYLSDMSKDGMDEFIRQFYGQTDKQGMVVDVRYNGGGFIDQIILSRLRRVLEGLDTNRQAVPFKWPAEMVHGYKVCLINHYSASDGDIFPYFFKAYGLGPLIGERTWGGVRGIRGEWELADGGYITVPEMAMYGLDSEWLIENHGVEPDIEVDNLPGDVMAGHDAQLERGIEHIKAELAKKPMTLPPAPPWLPAYPPAGRIGGEQGQ